MVRGGGDSPTRVVKDSGRSRAAISRGRSSIRKRIRAASAAEGRRNESSPADTKSSPILSKFMRKSLTALYVKTRAIGKAAQSSSTSEVASSSSACRGGCVDSVHDRPSAVMVSSVTSCRSRAVVGSDGIVMATGTLATSATTTSQPFVIAASATGPLGRREQVSSRSFTFTVTMDGWHPQ